MLYTQYFAALKCFGHLLQIFWLLIFANVRVHVSLVSFYRYVLEPELSFSPDGSEAVGPRAIFSQLPHSPLLTLHMDVPHAWLVAALHSPHDLDNIHLQSVESGVQAEFLLEHILVEGMKFQV